MIRRFCCLMFIAGFSKNVVSQIPSFIDQSGIKSISSLANGCVYNSAFLPDQDQQIIGIKGMNFYDIQGLSSVYALGAVSMGTQGIGFYAGHLAYSSISQLDAGLCYGIKLSKNTHIGVRAKYFRMRHFDQTMAQQIYFDFSTIYNINSRVVIASHIENIANSTKAFILLNTQIHVGLRYDISEQVQFCSELSKEMTQSLLFKYSILYTYQKKLQISWGGNWNPQSYFLGIGYQWGKIKCQVDVKTHSVLGQVYSTGIFYLIDRK